MVIRAARPDEAAELSALAWRSKQYWGYSSEVMRGWSAALHISAVDIAAHATYAAEEDGELVGCYALMKAQPAWQLEHFWVDPGRMGRGIGRALVEHAIGIARQGGVKSIAIDADPNAEAFYLACGAKRVGEIAAPIPNEPGRVRPQLVLELA